MYAHRHSVSMTSVLMYLSLCDSTKISNGALRPCKQLNYDKACECYKVYTALLRHELVESFCYDLVGFDIETTSCVICSMRRVEMNESTSICGSYTLDVFRVCFIDASDPYS